ncbi:hypothetical protein D3C77_733590 [compost metagenome]
MGGRLCPFRDIRNTFLTLCRTAQGGTQEQAEQLGLRTNIQLAVNILAMIFYRAQADKQPFGDLLRSVAAQDQIDDLTFTWA